MTCTPRPYEIVLRDARRLGIAELGTPSGRPVLYLHGAIGSPMRSSDDLDATTAALGVRWIMVSRPGFGTSDPHPGRTVLDHAHDIEDVLDALALPRASVVGVSAGGPYALACAHLLAGRVDAVAAVSSLVPGGRPGTGSPPPLRAGLGILARHPRACAAAGDAALRSVQRRRGLLDRAARRDGARGTAALTVLSAGAGGIGAMVEDYLLGIRPWGFDPGAARGTPVHLWHGLADGVVPAHHALWLARAIPHAQAVFAPGEGHFFLRRRLREILAALLASGGATHGRVAGDVAPHAAAQELERAAAATCLDDPAPRALMHDDLGAAVAPAEQDDLPRLLDGQFVLHDQAYRQLAG